MGQESIEWGSIVKFREVHRLEFLNPLYHAGLNVTVRKGEKWAAKANPGDMVEIFRTGENVALARAQVLWVAYYKDIDAIPGYLLLNEHDPACRYREGLIYAMERAYPDYQPRDAVSLIIFGI